MLEILSAQAAISLENARLYDTLESRVRAAHARADACALERPQGGAAAARPAGEARLARRAHLGHRPRDQEPAQLRQQLRRALRASSARELGRASRGSARPGSTRRPRATSRRSPRRPRGERRPHRAARQARATPSSAGCSSTRAAAPARRAPSTSTRWCATTPPPPCTGSRARGTPVAPPSTCGSTTRLGEVKLVPEEIGRVVLNLVNNARLRRQRRAQAEGPPARRRRDDARRGRRRWRSACATTGQASRAIIRDKVFDPFFTTKPAGEGAGLGLSLELRHRGAGPRRRARVRDRGGRPHRVRRHPPAPLTDLTRPLRRPWPWPRRRRAPRSAARASSRPPGASP